MTLEEYEPFASLGLALAAGLLIGLERQQTAPSAEEARVFLGGVRTHPLFAMLGAVSVLLSRALGVWPPLVAGAGVLLLLAISYADDVKNGRDRGLTSEGALFLSFLLGALSLSAEAFASTERRFLVIAALAVVATTLLSSKPFLHQLVKRVSNEDIAATLKFLLVAVVLLPLLPDARFGPLDVLNPFEIGLMVALIAGISFVGYLAIRLLGAQRGIGLTGLVGGLVSSTAVTLSFSGQAKRQPELAPSCALAVVLASSIMFGRVLVEVAVVNPALLAALAFPTGFMAGAGLLVSLYFYRRSRSAEDGAGAVEFKNPFELSSAFKFALLFAAVLLAAEAATTYLGTGATYLAGVLAGATDVDAITLTMARLAETQISPQVASTTIALGMASNTIVKAGLATAVGGRPFGRQIALAFGLILAAGGAGLAVMWLTAGNGE
jgi:uncharacterized membrane protein (DUF4010 family)